ncbi:MAG: hypothetical protein OXI20_15655 [Rhodospirillales bacterium]|nr:hypothetical protein [Rhodospirillales bacterium]
MTKVSSAFLKQKEFYHRNYVYLSTPSHLLPNTPTIVLGDQGTRRCRFCGNSEPETRFTSKAHAIPECLGNKSLFTKYECDTCNEHFGSAFERDLGNWSIVSRVLAGIRGKRRVPRVEESGSQSGLRVTQSSVGLVYTEFGDSSIIILDENNKQVQLDAKRYAYRPRAVLKSFVKIGLTLLPDDEIGHFSETLTWLRNADHSRSFFQRCPVIDTFICGPSWRQLIIVRLLRRKSHCNDLPYTFLILGFANHLFQVWLPCRAKDEHIWNVSMEIPPFIPINASSLFRYGNPVTRNIDLSGDEVVKDEKDPHTLVFDSFETK